MPGDPLRVTLEVAERTVAVGDPVIVTVRLTNDGDETVFVVRPLVVPPLVYITIEDAIGFQLPFLGPSADTREFNREKFVELTSGGSVEAAYDLAGLFPLRPDAYTVQAEYVNLDDGARFDLNALVTPRDAGVFSNRVELTMEP